MMKDKLVEGYGFIGTEPNTLYKFGNGKYKTFEGTEIVAENCLKAKVKDLVIEGKTYQNLVSNLDELVGNVYTRDTVAIIDTSLFKANTTYTAIVTISESNYSLEKYGAIFSIFYPTLTNGYASISLKDGTFKLTFITKEETPSKIQVGVQYGNSATSSFKLNNLIILEGDYTNIDLPDNINGIESVSEKENNILSVKINDNTTTLNLPISLRALPNGVADTIEGNTLVQRVGKVILDGSQSINKSTIAYHENVARVQWKNTNLKIGRDNSYCDKFPNGNNDNDTQHYKLGGAVNTAFFYIPIEYTNNISSYFEENPTTLYYELIEPIIHDITVPQLSTAKGTNIITTSNNIKPKISMKVKVK